MDYFLNNLFIPTGFAGLGLLVVLWLVNNGVVNAPHMPLWALLPISALLGVYGLFAGVVWLISKSGL